MTRLRGVVINVHQLGATVRLEDGSLAAVGAGELALNRPAYLRSMQRREPLSLVIDTAGRRTRAALPVADGAAPAGASADGSAASDGGVELVDVAFEDRINAYLKATEEWAPPDRPPPAERHFIRKKRRAAYFEARTKPT